MAVLQLVGPFGLLSTFPFSVLHLPWCSEVIKFLGHSICNCFYDFLENITLTVLKVVKEKVYICINMEETGALTFFFFFCSMTS